MKFLVLNGPNLNMLGIREPEIYGKKTYKDLVEMITAYALKSGLEVEVYQSNHEGDLVDKIQSAYGNYDGIVINPAAYTHTSIALLDALKAVGIPALEVHISDVGKREDFRKISFIRTACVKTVSGKGFDGYIEALEYLSKNIGEGKC
ncbi:MAG: type II 3-dehydroquinate dehydratase [Clostridia bacterium]|nr:type II 3-dehydroquinate dehydratase [Clostridia bacterium]